MVQQLLSQLHSEINEAIGEKNGEKIFPLLTKAFNSCVSHYEERRVLLCLDKHGNILGSSDFLLELFALDENPKTIFELVDRRFEEQIRALLASKKFHKDVKLLIHSSKQDFLVNATFEHIALDQDVIIVHLKKREIDYLHLQIDTLNKKVADLLLRVTNFEPLMDELLELFIESQIFDLGIVAKVDRELYRVVPKLVKGESEIKDKILKSVYDFNYFKNLLDVIIEGEDFISQDVVIEGTVFQKQIIFPLFNKWEYEKSNEVSYMVLLFSNRDIKLDSFIMTTLREIIYKINIAITDIFLKEKASLLISTDILTGLPKREIFFKELQRYIDEEVPFAVAIVDIDKLRKVNDVLGFWAGDKAMITLAQFLKREVDNCFVSRYGSDEFAILIKGNKSAIYHILDKIFSFNDNLVQINGSSIYLPISIGVSFFPQDGKKLEDMILKAENALKRAKKSDGKKIVYGNNDTVLLPKDYLQLEKELK